MVKVMDWGLLSGNVVYSVFVSAFQGRKRGRLFGWGFPLCRKWIINWQFVVEGWYKVVGFMAGWRGVQSRWNAHRRPLFIVRPGWGGGVGQNTRWGG
jgi:hypothetical protein